MTITEELQELIDEYLDRLDATARTLSASRRIELLAEIKEHITVAIADGGATDEAAVRNILDRLGDPEDIVREAGGVPATPAPRPADPTAPVGPRPAGSPGIYEILTVVVLLFGGIVAPLFGWVAGVVMLWASQRWDNRAKLIGTLVWPGGLAAAAYLFASGNEDVRLWLEEWVPEHWVLTGLRLAVSGGLQVALIGGPILTAIYLLRRAHRPAAVPSKAA